MSRNENRLGLPESPQQDETPAPVAANTEAPAFNWSVPTEFVELPSKGLFYSPGHPLHNVTTTEIRYMTAKEEDILTSRSLLKEGVALDRMLQNLLVDKTINVSSLLIGDKNALLVAARRTGYGPEYHASSACKSCGQNNEILIDLTSIPIKRLNIKPSSAGENRFEFKLPVTKKAIIFKYNTAREERERNVANKSMQKVTGASISNNVTSFLENSIVSVDGITDRMKIKHFVMNMPAFDSKALRKFIIDSEPGMDMSCEFECKNCGTHNESTMPMTSEFFWPTK